MKRRDSLQCIPMTLVTAGGMLGSIQSKAQCVRGCSGEGGLPAAMEYVGKVKDMLNSVRSTQSEKILESAYAIARTVIRGNTCWGIWDQGHTHTADIFPGRNGEPEIVTPGYDPDKAKKGDLVLISYSIGQETLDDIRKKGIFVIGAASPVNGDCRQSELLGGGQENIRVRPYADIWIDTDVTSYGALVGFPGMPSPLGPESGPLYMTLFWMMLADVCRVLAIENRSVPVKGDEPPLARDAGRVKLADPLMDDFFDEVMLEFDLIGAELGAMRKIASMVADTLLGGGTSYVYSRYSQSLAAEGTSRRGGFMFVRDTSDGNIKGTTGDSVVMGIYKPDDEADLKNLDDFRKRGVRIASIGPVSRDFATPDKQTVPKQTEAHIGRMTDTYGLFALPGFERKVCPTSGILVTTMYWALCMEIMEEMRARTGGDLPAVYFNGVLRPSTDYGYNRRMRVMQEGRGY